MTQMEISNGVHGTHNSDICESSHRAPRLRDAESGILNADQHQECNQNEIIPVTTKTEAHRLLGFMGCRAVPAQRPSLRRVCQKRPLTNREREGDRTARDGMERENFPGRDASWDVRRSICPRKKRLGRVIYLGSRAALSTAPGATPPSKPSKYPSVIFADRAQPLCREASILSAYAILMARLIQDALHWAETEPETSSASKETLQGRRK